jgi:hypothetical protein
MSSLPPKQPAGAGNATGQPPVDLSVSLFPSFKNSF